MFTFFFVLLSRAPTPCPSFHPIFFSSSTPTDIFTGTTRSCSRDPPGIIPSDKSEVTTRLRRFCSLPWDKNSSFVAILLGAIPNSSISSSSIKSSGLCALCSPFFERDDTKVDGCQPSFVPTVLKYPAENPPVKAPWNRLLPSASVTTCSCIGTAFFRGASSSRGSNGVPKLASVSSSSLAAILKICCEKRITSRDKPLISTVAQRIIGVLNGDRRHKQRLLSYVQRWRATRHESVSCDQFVFYSPPKRIFKIEFHVSKKVREIFTFVSFFIIHIRFLKWEILYLLSTITKTVFVIVDSNAFAYEMLDSFKHFFSHVNTNFSNDYEIQCFDLLVRTT